MHLRGIFDLLRSLKLTAATMGSLIGMYLLSLITPQKWMFSTREQYDLWVGKNVLNRALDALGITEAYTSPITIFLLSVFFLNLIIVIINRTPMILRKAQLIGVEPPAVNPQALMLHPASHKVELAGAAGMDEAMAHFRSSRWHVQSSRDGAGFVAIRNRYSPVGFLLFHVSFVLCLIGGLSLGYTRFSGELALTEGQDFSGDIRQFSRILSEPKALKKMPQLGLLLQSVDAYYIEDIPSELEAEVDVFYDSAIVSETLRVNQPIRRSPYTILVTRIGVSPLFEVLGPSGEFLDGAYVTLDVMDGKQDSFSFDREGGYTFDVRFFPDHEIVDGLDTSKSIELKNPALNLSASYRGKLISERTLKQGEFLDLGGFKVGFVGYRHWVTFLIVREYGNGPLIAGFALAAVGLIMRLVFYQRRLRAAVVDEAGVRTLYIQAESEYFPNAFKEEVANIVARLDHALNMRGEGR